MNDNNKNPLPIEEKKRDLAGDTARSYISSPITPLFLMVGMIIGIMGMMFTPRQEDPQISVPMVDIMVQYPGATNRQVEGMVSEPLERLLKEIKGVEHVYSASDRGQAIVTVQFFVGENMETSLVNVYSKIMSNMDMMPAGVLQPMIKPRGADDVPVVTVTLSSDELDSSQLRLLGHDVLQKIASVPQTSQGFVVGGEPEEIAVEVDPEKLSGYDISLTQIGQTIRAANNEKTAGSFAAWQQSFIVYTGEYLENVGDIEDLIVGVKNKAPVFVRDIATVTERAKDATNLVVYYTGDSNPTDHYASDGQAAVTVAIAKQAGANGVSVAAGVLEKLESIKGVIIPDAVNVRVTRNYGESANDKVNELIFKLFIATGSVTLLIWFFLGWRAAAVVAVIIPLVILTTVFAAWMMGMTIDRVSLFALIFSIGILVDDAVVVLENIYRRWLLDGDSSEEVTIDAVSEVGNPTIIATFAVIAALMPMAFVSGMMGPYMAPIPALGSVAMIISLFAAFAFTPWLAQRLKPSMEELQKSEKKEHEQAEKTGNFFRKLLGSLLVEKVKGWGFLIGIIVVFALASMLVYTAMVPVKLLPYDNKPDFSVVINFPEGTDLPITANLTHNLVKTLQIEVPEITTMESYVGTAAPFDFNGLVRHYYLRSQPWQADIQVHLVDKGERDRSSHQIAETVRTVLQAKALDAGANIEIVEMPPGPPVLQSIVAEVYGPNEKIRNETAVKLTEIFKKAEMVVDTDNYITAAHDSWRFIIDKQKAMESGISVSAINQTVEMAMGGYKLGDVKQDFKRGMPTFIVIQTSDQIRAEFARIGQIPVQSSFGNTVPLNELGHFAIEPQQSVLYHKDLKPVQYVTGTGQGRLGAPIYGMIEVQRLINEEKSFNGLSGNYVFTPSGLTEEAFIWAGEWTVTYQTFRDMGVAFGVALLVIYMLVVWEFKNFLVPLIVMAPIPLTIIGIAPGHWLMGAEFTATSMIGFIALAGIIVRNSILLVDFTRKEIARGTNVTDSVIFACRARTRPIVITAVALVLGSSVILFDPIFQGMAISLIFGVIVATILTLVVIPLGCVSARNAFCLAGEGSDSDSGNPCAKPIVSDVLPTKTPLVQTKEVVTKETSINKSVSTEKTPTKKVVDETPSVKRSADKTVVKKTTVKIKESVEKKPVVKKMVEKTSPVKKSPVKKKIVKKVTKKAIKPEPQTNKPITPTKRKRGIQLKDLDDE